MNGCIMVKDARWQNAIEGYLNTQKKYLIIDPQYFEEASKIYRELARENEKIHSFGIVDIEKIRKELEKTPQRGSRSPRAGSFLEPHDPRIPARRIAAGRTGYLLYPGAP